MKSLNYLHRNRKVTLFVFLSFSIIFFALTPSFGQNPFIPKYDAVKRSERCFTVTWEAKNQFGAVWWADKVDFSSDTLFNFVVYMGDLDGNGADGLAFVMHQDPRDTITDPSKQVIIGGAGTWDLEAATGDDGGGLGFAMHDSRVDANTIPGPYADYKENHKIQNSVAVEMDTWNNRDVPDGNAGQDANLVNQVKSPYYSWDHTAVIYNGDLYGGQQVISDANGNTGRILPLKPAYAFGSGNNPDGSPHHNIEDDRCYLFQIKWEVNPDGTQTLQLWADVYNGTTNTDGLQMIMTHTDDMINTVFGGDPVMRFGFTGSTGGAINEQTICLLGENLKPFAQDDYASIPMNNTAVIDVESNDNDPDGDQLHVPIIIDQAKNGLATIFDSLDINYVRYTPNTNFVGLDTIGYVTCDVNSTKCYAKCDTAFVFIEVGCIPFDVDLTAISPNLVCTDSVPSNGSAQANVDATFIRGTVWYEGFEDLPSGATEDNDPSSSWSSNFDDGTCNSGSQIRVETFDDNQKFRVKMSTCEVEWKTGVIDISSATDVLVKIDLESQGDHLDNQDYLNVYYVLDGGAEIPFNNGEQLSDFGFIIANTNYLNGSTLQIVIRAKNDKGDDNYFWDNLQVTGIGAGVPDVSYNWYQGSTPSGSIIYTGAMNNGLNQGTYTVVAIDNATGCPSNPATITIDSAGINVPGGFIEQLSPFTNCKLPYDGALGAGILDGTDTLTIGYTFDWYHQEDPKISSFIQRNGPIAQNLESREYTVVITEIATGCDTTINAEVINAVSIPTVTANKIADITSCSNPNSGIGDANVGGIADGYRFEWYVGPAIGAGPPDFAGSTVNTFPTGTYTVQAIDSLTFCPSDPASITIVDLTVIPDLRATVDSEQISCDTLAPSGQLSGTVDVSGTPTTSGYSFNWYKGPNDIIPARAGYAGGPTADSLEAGTYRLVVVEDVTNCTSFLDTLIQDLTVTPPDITLAITDVTSCALPNGSITISVSAGENLADYIFDIYKGFGAITDSLLVSSNSNVITDLPVGNYTVIGKDIITKCETNPLTATIIDATVLPTTTIIADDQISCDPNNLTGKLTANMGFGAITDYSYDWFEDDLSGTPIPSSSIDGEVISNLDSGNYALSITLNTSQCTSVYYPSVNIGIELPIDSVSSLASTYCAPNGNGELQGFVLGTSNPISEYTFLWESVATGTTLTDTSSTVSGIEPGDFILTIRDNNTACLSNPAPITVDDHTVTPIPTIDPTDNSSCDVANPNGQIEVTTTNENPPYLLVNYTYSWFDNATGNQIATTGGPNGEIVNSISAGTYQLQIQNTTTSCSNSVLSQINDINIKPIIDAVIPDPADNCVEPYNSGADVISVNGGLPIPAGFTFEWTNLDGGPSISDSTSSIADFDLTDETLPPGNYQVIAYNEYNCPSDPITFEIKDDAISPEFTLSAFNNISCDPGLPVGSLVATANAGFTLSWYEWFINSPNPGNVISAPSFPDNTLLNLDDGTYAVRVTDGSNGCTSVEYAIIQDLPSSNPIIQNISLANLTRCDIENGELGYSVFPYDSIPPLDLTARTYTFYLTNGADSYNISTSGVTDNVNFISLGSGGWDTYVVDEFTHCQSLTITNTLTDAPEIIITTTINRKPASCVGNDGEALITVESIDGVNKDPTGPGFDFYWYEGIDFSTPFAANLLSSTNWAQEADNLEAIYYTIKVHDRNTQCEKDTTFYVPPDLTPVFLGTNPIDATQCSPGNGSLTALVDITTFGFAKDHSNYNYLMFEGSYVDLTWLVPGTTEYKVIDGATIADPINDPVDFGNDIEPGTYVIIAQEKAGSKCFGEPFIIEIGLNFDFPSFVFAITPDKSCVGGAGTGQLQETALPPANINYKWYLGTDTSVGSISSTNPTTANLYSGAYTLVAEITTNLPVIDGLGCIQDSLVIVPKVLDKINIVDAVTHNNNCAPFDGTILIIDIEENGNPVGVPGNYVDFNIFDADLKNYIPGSGDGVTIPWGEIGPGNYYLQAQNNITQCYTETLQVSVDDLSQNPVITIALNNPDYACDPLLANGELEATASGSQDPTKYDFTWYEGVLGGTVVSDAINPFIASGLSANNSSQLYIIEVVDTSGINKGCSAIREYTLLHQPTSVYILTPQITARPQTNCGPNGSIEIISISEEDSYTSITSSTPFPYTGIYNAQLLDQDLNTIDPIVNPYALFDPANGAFGTNNIPTDTYYVQASNVATGCAFGPLTQVIIKDESKNPIISAILGNPDYACIGGAPTGQLIPTVIGGSDGDILQTNFAITWVVKSSGSAAPGGTTATDLWPDVYTLQVVDATGLDLGCISTRDYTVTSARHDIDITASSLNQTICIPDGSVQLESISEDGNPIALPNPGWNVLLLDENKTDITPGSLETGFPGDPFTNISKGLYFIQAQDDATKCYSNPYQVIVNDLSENPAISIDITSVQYSLNPNPITWTGAMQADVTETGTGIPDPNGYVFSWHAGIDGGNLLSNLDNVSSVDEGYYTFIAVSNTTGCESRYYKYMPFEYLEPTFNTSVAPQTICSPNDGSIEVTDIALDNTPDDLLDYTFNWHHDTYSEGDAPDHSITGVNPPIYDNINAGSYYIIARENWWMLDSYPVKVEVIDSTTNPIIIFDATNYQPLTSCDESILADGALAVDVVEDNTNPYLNPPFDYGYTWYAGNVADPINEIADSTNNSISGLPSGDYTIVVVNLANNCQSENSFTIEDESITPIVTATQTPNTNCPIEIANGITSANVINSTSNYYFEWFDGTDANGASDYLGAIWKGRTSGYYTVRAVNQNLSTCVSEPVIIQVEDVLVHPTVLINEISPLTNCDPARPNGVLSATTQDGINGHTFTWYLDGSLYSSGPIASKLGLFDYQLVVMNNVTQCETKLVSSPTQLQSVVPPPNVDILNDRTSCLEPDGIATASISGNVTDYIFKYYNKFSSEELSNFYEDYKIYDLDTSTYLVTAEDRTTGCISDPTEFVISNETYYPEIDVITNPSNCQDPSGGATVILSDMTREFRVIWHGENGFEAQEKELVYIPAGKYLVEVEGTDGCVSSAEAQVKGDVIIYNGVSANYDGLNDFFQIVCLEYFPDNNVKIYSRSGLLVYEQDFYNMNDSAKRFEGISNKGASLIGTELPVGTYFYVVDKNDGSKPNVGYLELNR